MPAPDRYKFKPSRLFAEHAATAAPPAPEPMTAAQRRRLSGPELARRIAQEGRYVGRLYVPTPLQRECADQVWACLQHAQWGLPGPQDALYVLGRPGVGKSTAVYMAAAEYHRLRLAEEGLDGDSDPRWRTSGFISDFVPVVFVTFRSAAHNRAIVAQIAKYLGYTAATATDTTDELPGWARRHGIGLVVGDDVRNVADSGRAATAIHNLLKNLNTELGMLNAACIYIGIPDETGNGNLYANDQLEQRLQPFWINDFDFDMRAVEETEANYVWADYLEDWERVLAPVLPDLCPGDLSSVLARRLWNRTQGSVGGLASLLTNAAQAVFRDVGPRRRLTLTQERIEATPMAERFGRSPF